MTVSRHVSLTLCLLAISTLGVYAQSNDSGPSARKTYAKGTDCAALAASRSERSDCAEELAETRTIFLANTTAQNEANEILVAVRNMADPSVKIYLSATQKAITVRTYPQQIAQLETLIHELDRPHKVFRITFTSAMLEDGKSLGTQHYTLVASDGNRTTLKEGDKVPVATGSYSSGVNAGAQTQFTYIDIGMNFDATVDSIATGVTLKAKVEESSVGPTNTIAGVSEPVIRQSVLESVSILPLGKPLMLGSIDIPNSNRRMDVDVMVEQIK